MVWLQITADSDWAVCSLQTRMASGWVEPGASKQIVMEFPWPDDLLAEEIFKDTKEEEDIAVAVAGRTLVGGIVSFVNHSNVLDCLKD